MVRSDVAGANGRTRALGGKGGTVLFSPNGKISVVETVSSVDISLINTIRRTWVVVHGEGINVGLVRDSEQLSIEIKVRNNWVDTRSLGIAFLAVEVLGKIDTFVADLETVIATGDLGNLIVGVRADSVFVLALV